MRARAQASSVLDALGLSQAQLWLQSHRCIATQLPMLTYHHLGQLAADYPFDPGVVDATAELFDRQMAWISGLYTAITSEEIRAALAGAPLPGHPIAITFDDGYRSGLDVAVPILKRHGLRATFFIATSYITERRLFWWDRISYLITRSPREQVSLRYPHDVVLDLRGRGPRARAIQRLLQLVKRTFGLDVERLLDELAAAAEVRWDRETERAIADQLILTWDGVRALRAAGMDVQSHTCKHRVLSTLTAEVVRDELVESRRTLERELDAPVRAVSYPCGLSIGHRPDLLAAVRSAGYELGFASEGKITSVAEGRADPLNLRRLFTDYDMPMSWFRGMLAFPRLVHG